MTFRKLVLALASSAMIAGPALAQSSAPASVSRSGPAMDGEGNLEGGLSNGVIFGAIGFIAVLIAFIKLADDDDDGRDPVSP